MSLPGNGLLVVSGDAALLVTALRRSTRWGSHSFPPEEYDILMRMFRDLQALLVAVDDLRLLDPTTYLAPFLEVVRSKETTGPVTGMALSAINKFLAYGLIDPTHSSVPTAVEDIADAVTHARFVGTDPASDGVVLLKILEVLHTLMLSPEGAMLTDESVCEIMLSCFRIAFESRLNELLRRNAEHVLRDVTQLIFTRLPQFALETPGSAVPQGAGLSLSRKERPKRSRSVGQAMGTNSLESGIKTSTSTTNDKETNEKSGIAPTVNSANEISEAEITIELPLQSRSPQKKHARHSSMDLAANANTSITQILEKCVTQESAEQAETTALLQSERENTEDDTRTENETETSEDPRTEDKPAEGATEEERRTEAIVKEEGKEEMAEEKLEEYVNPRGIRFTPLDENIVLKPYGLNCVRELFKFLISLCNPLEPQNTPAMVHLGLSLVGTALEVGADHLARYRSLLALVEDPLCRNLLGLLNSDRLSIFALDLQVLFLLFESMRHHLKLQMEAFFKKLVEIISADVSKASYEMKEITHLSLESLAQLFRIPGLCTELYLNYDCDIYCTNLFEDLTKLLSKHAVSSTAYNTHALALDALMTIIDAIESTSAQKVAKLEEKSEKTEELEDPPPPYDRGGHVSLELGGLDDASVVSDHVTHDIRDYLTEVRIGRHVRTSEVPSEAELDSIKKRKRWIAKGTELFNTKPEKGISYLQEQGLLQDPHQIAVFLRENVQLDKKMIGEYVCKRSKSDDDGSPSVLAAFADSFDYTGLRIDKALRLYLETFRLPGEAPLIFLVMEHFAERWHTCNGSPFANTDAAFRLAYAVIMLNMDQHNHNAKKLNVPMTADEFVRNLRGCNGSGDFDTAMLEGIFHSIKSDEIVMPAEHTGILKENYMWKVLLRRGVNSRYLAAQTGTLDTRLFDIVWGPTVTALSAAFERAPPPSAEDIESGNPRDCPALRALAGLEQCTGIASVLSAGNEPTVDTLVLSMCKFASLAVPDNSYISIGVALGQSTKTQMALRRACAVIARHADGIRDSWKNVIEILRTLFVGRLLPKALTEADDFIAESGRVSLVREPSGARADSGLLSSLYSYIALGETMQRTPSHAERICLDVAVDCVDHCGLENVLVADTKFLQLDSLQELVRQLIQAGAPPSEESLQMNPQLEDVMVFFLELVVKITVQNRDRVLYIWHDVAAYIDTVLAWASLRDPTDSYASERALTALLKAAVQLMRSEECASTVLRSLDVLMRLPYRVFYHQADRISRGLYELVKTSAQNVHDADDWNALLGLIAAAGAGSGVWRDDDAATPSTGYGSASSRSEGSEDEGAGSGAGVTASSDSELSHSPAQGWILVQNSSDHEPHSLDLEHVKLRPHRACALARCTEALALVVRDVAHVTPYNFPATVRTVRLLVQASFDGGKKASAKSIDRERRRHAMRRRRQDDSDEEDVQHDQYHTVSIQLLDLMHTLHSRTSQIFSWWREETGLPHSHATEEWEWEWEVAWMPLLQGIAKLCTDTRKQVANSAVAYLQRALLAPGLRALGGAGWERCFMRVLFPLLERLVRKRGEIAARANTVACKVFLHHLSALSSRPSFPALWLRVVSIQRTLVSPPDAKMAPDDALREAALESLKNMILVMDSVKVFAGADGYNDLWQATWERVEQFLPGLKQELFPNLGDANAPPEPTSASGLVPAASPAQSAAPLPVSGPVVRPVPISAPIPLPAVARPVPVSSSPPTVRNPLYMPPGPPSTVLLQPLSQCIWREAYEQSGYVPPRHVESMVSTPIGITLTPQSTTPQAFPILSINVTEPSKPANFTLVGQNVPDFKPIAVATNVELINAQPVSVQPQIRPISPEIQQQNQDLADAQHQNRSSSLQMHQQHQSVPPGIQNQNKFSTPNSELANIAINMGDDIEQSEIYSEYLTNPYNEAKEVSSIEATLYDTRASSVAQIEPEQRPIHFLEKPKSLSVNSTPMHRPAHFSSSDNLPSDSSGIFNYSSYFSVASSFDIPPGSEVLFGDSALPTREG